MCMFRAHPTQSARLQLFTWRNNDNIDVFACLSLLECKLATSYDRMGLGF